VKCKYNGCKVDAFHNEDLCILHIPLPKNDSQEFMEITELKKEMINNQINNGNLNFKGVKLLELDFSGFITENDVIFTNSVIESFVKFDDSTIGGDIWFDNTKIGGNVSFERTQIDGSASFYRGDVKEHVWFDNAKVARYAWFEEACVGGEASFNGVDVGSSLSFKNGEIDGNTSFYGARIRGDAWFEGAKIGGDVWFDFAEIDGGLSFKNTEFIDLKSQEKACRKAKTIWEKLGDRERADYHFYREMSSKRLQKPNYLRWPEIIVQYPFGYGVYPRRLLLTFFLVFIIFAGFFWILGGILSFDALLEKMRLSFLTIIVPAYGVINAKGGLLGVLIIIEAVIGAFTWPTFIVTFARKYMR
jgi:Pentapeptide repeats (9 copies)